MSRVRTKKKQGSKAYPYRWKYPLNLLSIGESVSVSAELYWPVNAARTRAEKVTGYKFSLRRTGEQITVMRKA